MSDPSPEQPNEVAQGEMLRFLIQPADAMRRKPLSDFPFGSLFPCENKGHT